MTTLSFFRSAIKSGESWTSECEAAYQKAWAERNALILVAHFAKLYLFDAAVGETGEAKSRLIRALAELEKIQ